ncbi:hypothetical protein COU78_05970 [Candidatus Peregrinibacteria bacterium CG10_big_fil_rev_8_21_14_0_10_49_24]|nr:MAG: hypothetical protein COV83_04675 [Candidatus Peregrinibacteria bacterium CG11_big_fil_rev_8_21_14_0_20_49_14]PIR50567.1 MAG: hypothetical protein COU78_05970 [Candidatus Peregrinibacteria bacterium CG10_big_fil_rev_8_21_14_0_10_49_24]PJA67937.1 MAG: hypothetical protein CO157_02140 [Candidatus Peregrinibacteria bacterium CG_4_9_14_3_um_filter_49_12]
MQFLALETDINKIKQAYCHEGECEVLFTRYHGLSFLFAILREILITVVLFTIAIFGWMNDWPMGWLVGILFALWIIFVLFNVLKAYIDWAYDFIYVTTDKILIVDQTSLFRREIKPLHMENIGSVSTETQMWGIFPFGKLCVHLKEGLGGDDMTLKYVPYANKVASQISAAVTRYQRET